MDIKLTPAERIKEFLIDFLQPVLHEQGFKFYPTNFSFKKNLIDFEQEIRFSRSKWNSTDTFVEFDTHLKVSSKTYKKWYRQEYKSDLQNDIIYAIPANYISNWSREFQVSGWYNLVAVDKREIGRALLYNINDSGIHFLNALSTWQTAIDYNFENFGKVSQVL